jgi:hypothetical protein
MHVKRHRLSGCKDDVNRVSEAFTRMIYTHVLNKPGIGVKSPLDVAGTLKGDETGMGG